MPDRRNHGLSRRCVLLLAPLLAACGTLTPTAPTPTATPRIGFEMLVDLGVFGGPPALPPHYSTAQLDEETVLILVDRPAGQQLIAARWNGARWQSVGHMGGTFLPAAEQLVLRRLEVTSEDGLPSAATLVLGRVPNGPINQLDLTIDGTEQRLQVPDKPAMLLVFPPGTQIGDRYQMVDAGSLILGEGELLRTE